MEFKSKIKTIEWISSKNVSRMVDQLVIPYEYKLVDIRTSNEMFNAIKTMIVRGAPAIGIAGAHGMALSAIEISKKTKDRKEFLSLLKEKAEFLKSARPTAVNLMWAVDKQYNLVKNSDDCVDAMVQLLIDHGIELENEDIEINKKIGDFGAELVPKKGATILTHCNAGALATVGYGTALGVVRSAFAKDNTIQVFADETRPRQQGARITTFELVMDKIPVTLVTDGMSGYFMNKGIWLL